MDLEKRRRLRVPGGREPIGDRHRRLAPRSLITVNAVREPHGDGQVATDLARLSLGGPPRIGKPLVCLLDAILRGEVLRIGNGEEEKRSPLVGLSVLLDLHAVGGLGEGREIVHDAMVRGESRPHRVAQKRLRRRDRRIEVAAGIERRRAGRSGPEEEHYEEPRRHPVRRASPGPRPRDHRALRSSSVCVTSRPKRSHLAVASVPSSQRGR